MGDNGKVAYFYLVKLGTVTALIRAWLPKAWLARLVALNRWKRVLYFVTVPRASSGGGNPYVTA